MNQAADQIKYGQVKEVNFAIDQWKHGHKIMIEMCLAHIKGKSAVAERPRP